MHSEVCVRESAQHVENCRKRIDAELKGNVKGESAEKRAKENMVTAAVREMKQSRKEQLKILDQQHPWTKKATTIGTSFEQQRHPDGDE